MHDEASADQLLRSVEARLSLPAHDLLGVDRGAPAETVREALAVMVQRLHPGQFVLMSRDTQRRAASCARALRDAYWTLELQRGDRRDAVPISSTGDTTQALTRRLQPLRSPGT